MFLLTSILKTLVKSDIIHLLEEVMGLLTINI